MIQRDRNHSSIIMWSLGNEAGCGGAQISMADWARVHDPTRPLHYESGGSRTRCTDIICPMYARVQTCEHMLQEDVLDKRPIILCEYSHAMGNSNGSDDRYWECFRREGPIQGGFVWDWVDQGLDAVALNGVQYWAYGGDFGDVPNDAQFCINGLVSQTVLRTCVVRVQTPDEACNIYHHWIRFLGTPDLISRHGQEVIHGSGAELVELFYSP